MAIFSYSLLPKILKFRRSSLKLVLLIKIVYNIVRTPPPPSPLFKEGGSKFWLPPPEWGIWKIRKRGRNYGAGAGAGVCVLGGGGITEHIEIALPFTKLCYAFEEKLFFSVTIILWKKVILSCLKMNLKISHKLR